MNTDSSPPQPNSGPSRDASRSRILQYVALSLILLFAYGMVRESAWQGSAALHTLMEVIATLLAAIIGGMALFRYYAKKTSTFLFIGSGFLGTAFLDGYHTVVTSAFFSQNFPSGLSSLIPWSWTASRIFLSVLLWLSWVAWNRERKLGAPGQVRERTVYVWVTVMTLASFVFFAFAPLPPAYYPDFFFPRPEEFLPAAFFLLAAIGYLKKGYWRNDSFEHWLVLSLITGFIGQAVFMSFSGQLFDMMFDAAHLLKKVSYVMVLTGLMVSMFFLFQSEEKSRLALLNSVTRTRAVVENAVDGIITIDDRGTVLQINPAVEKIFGFSRDELIGHNVNKLMPSPYRSNHDGYLQNYREASDKKNVGFSRELVGKRKNGEEFPLELAVSEMDVAGQTTFVGITRDITERKRTEEALQDSVQKFRNLFEHANDAIFVSDPETLEFIDVNENALQHIGYTRDELFALRVSDISPDAVPGTLRRNLDNLKKLGHAIFETQHLRKDGVIVPVEISSRYIEYGGRMVLLSFVRNIQERKKSEADIREKTAIVEMMHSIAVAANEAESIESVIQACLDEVCAHTQWPVGHAYLCITDPVKKLVPTLIWHLDNPGQYAKFRVITEQTEFAYGVGLPGRVMASGSPAWIRDVREDDNFPRATVADEMEVRSAFAMPILNGSEVAAVLEFFSPQIKEPDDVLMKSLSHIGSQLGRVFERKQVEIMKNEFISTVSHELRTPLTSIQGSLALITKGVDDDLPEKHRKLIGIAHKNCERLVRLINDILDIEKIESGNIVFSLSPTEIKPLIEQSIEANQSYAKQFSVSLDFICDADDAKANLDQDRFLQVMTNLLSNAVKFSPAGEIVTVTLRRNADKLKIEVIDRGEGIPVEFRDKIFGKFAQADSSAARKKEGTGLGLSISRAIVEKHSGTINFETETGSGTNFFFELPEWRDVTMESVYGDPAVRMMNILVCQPDPDEAELMTLMLGKDDVACTVVNTAAKAKMVIDDDSFSAIIVDLDLPDSTGLELLRALRDSETTQNTPAIMIASRPDVVLNKQNPDSLNIIDWLPKPVDYDRLLATLKLANAKSRHGNLQILHVENDPDVLVLTATALGAAVEINSAETIQVARGKIRSQVYNLILLDLVLPDGNGLELIQDIRNANDGMTPIVLFTAHDVPLDVSRHVDAVLIKSRTSVDHLKETIAGVIGITSDDDDSALAG